MLSDKDIYGKPSIINGQINNTNASLNPDGALFKMAVNNSSNGPHLNWYQILQRFDSDHDSTIDLEEAKNYFCIFKTYFSGFFFINYYFPIFYYILN